MDMRLIILFNIYYIVLFVCVRASVWVYMYVCNGPDVTFGCPFSGTIYLNL